MDHNLSGEQLPPDSPHSQVCMYISFELRHQVHNSVLILSFIVVKIFQPSFLVVI